MKDTIHYQVGQNVGNFTISHYENGEGLYTLTCSCGKTSTGGHDHITRKISMLMSEGYVACQSCMATYITNLRDEREKNDTMYTYKDVYREYVKKAKSRDISFSISLEDCYNLFSKPCYYCGENPNNCRTRHNGAKIMYQGLDRIDNNVGYTKENVVPCCKYCNSFKMDRTTESFLEHVSKIYFNKVQRLVSQET